MTMRAMVLEKIGRPLQLKHVPIPEPGEGQLLIEVVACAVCRTDLHVSQGDLPHPKLPLILGHQIVGKVVEVGPGVTSRTIGEKVGVPWLGKTCGNCPFCRTEKENLCDRAEYTGYTQNGGFAEFCLAEEKFCFPIPSSYDDEHAAPLLCAGLIGYRALKFTGHAHRIGFYGFGSSAHILLQVALHMNREVFVFTRKGDKEGQDFAKKLGATWAGSSDTPAPKPLDAAILFAPIGTLVPTILQSLNKAGILVCAGIHMTDIPTFAYKLLWEERQIRSVSNLTREDAREFLSIASRTHLHVKTHPYKLEEANEALRSLKEDNIVGTNVLKIK